MKVLFAVNNDNISDAIIKKYQKEYKEIITYKNVYYFNAIIKELQNDKTYDRVVISEELEPFANNNYDTIDKFLFEKLDKISDEATKANGDNIDIILICADRRSQGSEMLTRLFGIGIYNALIGEQRNIDNLCKLLNQPRTKKEAKMYYKIDGSSIGYQVEDENNVSEAEVQNILAHYKRLGKDEDKYVDSFNNIVAQYTDAQLRIIIRYLPLSVKAVLEERSPKYQELATFGLESNGKVLKTPYTQKTVKTTKSEEKINVKMLQDEKDNITKPIVIPETLNNKKRIIDKPKELDSKKMTKSISTLAEEADEALKEVEEDNITESDKKRGRGRPRKNSDVIEKLDTPKRGRGRPKKVVEEDSLDDEEDAIDLFNIDSDVKSEANNVEEDVDLFNLNEEQEDNIEEIESEDDIDLFNLDSDEKEEDNSSVDLFNLDEEIEDNSSSFERKDEVQSNTNTNIVDTNNTVDTGNLNSIITKEKKIVTFVGTTKNGTSFIVNNLALILASQNISTAILDITKSRNAYYIFTKNDQKLRDIAENSITNLSDGEVKGIEVNKNLAVYTELPGKEITNINVERVLSSLLEKHNIVLIDADFETPIEYFEKSQEIYLVQSMDILTIQPLTAFLRNLKSKDVLQEEKLKIIINKWEKVKNLSDKVLIGGISSYNDPAMSYMTELFNKDKIIYCKIPYETQNNVKYLESLVDCEISLKGYTKQLINSLNELAAMVYPLLQRDMYTPMGNKKGRMEFSDSTKNTLNKMKKNY